MVVGVDVANQDIVPTNTNIITMETTVADVRRAVADHQAAGDPTKKIKKKIHVKTTHRS
jgi:hypothetical protein